MTDMAKASFLDDVSEEDSPGSRWTPSAMMSDFGRNLRTQALAESEPLGENRADSRPRASRATATSVSQVKGRSEKWPTAKPQVYLGDGVRESSERKVGEKPESEIEVGISSCPGFKTYPAGNRDH